MVPGVGNLLVTFAFHLECKRLFARKIPSLWTYLSSTLCARVLWQRHYKRQWERKRGWWEKYNAYTPPSQQYIKEIVGTWHPFIIINKYSHAFSMMDRSSQPGKIVLKGWICLVYLLHFLLASPMYLLFKIMSKYIYILLSNIKIMPCIMSITLNVKWKSWFS